jgi:hypothetical protein
MKPRTRRVRANHETESGSWGWRRIPRRVRFRVERNDPEVKPRAHGESSNLPNPQLGTTSDHVNALKGTETIGAKNELYRLDDRLVANERRDFVGTARVVGVANDFRLKDPRWLLIGTARYEQHP